MVIYTLTSCLFIKNIHKNIHRKYLVNPLIHQLPLQQIESALSLLLHRMKIVVVQIILANE